MSMEEETEKRGVIDTWLDKHRSIYTAATDPLISRPSELGCECVDPSRKRIRRDFRYGVVLGGLASLNDETEWFKREGSKWNVDFSTIVPQKANQEYRSEIEAVYQESFAHCLEDGNKTPVELTGACHRWGNVAFEQYCLSVKNVAERFLENASGEVLTEAEDALVRVLEHEVAFWEMSRVGK